jgi:hypothetical protein
MALNVGADEWCPPSQDVASLADQIAGLDVGASEWTPSRIESEPAGPAPLYAGGLQLPPLPGLPQGVEPSATAARELEDAAADEQNLDEIERAIATNEIEEFLDAQGGPHECRQSPARHMLPESVVYSSVLLVSQASPTPTSATKSFLSCCNSGLASSRRMRRTAAATWGAAPGTT